MITYSQSTTASRTRLDFDAVAEIAAAQRRAQRKKLRTLRRIRRAVHFFGFLCYWAVALSIGFLAVLAIMALFVYLA